MVDARIICVLGVERTYCETGEQLLGELVRDGLALLALVVLERLEAGESSTSSYKLVAEGALVLLEVVVLVDLVVGLLRVSPSERHVGGVWCVGRVKCLKGSLDPYNTKKGW